jgi:Soluble lytic murein transglycosylase and related regulatory proteins (some contain LysM/invasin domains)
MRITTEITRKQFFVIMALAVILILVLLVADHKRFEVHRKSRAVQEDSLMQEDNLTPVSEVNEKFLVEETRAIHERGNLTESEFFQSERLAGLEKTEINIEDDAMEGFVYYQIPEIFTVYGGYFPIEEQEHLWRVCSQNEIDYYIAVALIERESGYRIEAVGDSGNSKGYMQIQEKWHKERMAELDVNDLYNPYHNIITGVDYLAEIAQKHNDDYNKILMVYNMGETGARRNWESGFYSTTYSRGIIERAQEIKQELQD